MHLTSRKPIKRLRTALAAVKSERDRAEVLRFGEYLRDRDDASITPEAFAAKWDAYEKGTK